MAKFRLKARLYKPAKRTNIWQTNKKIIQQNPTTIFFQLAAFLTLVRTGNRLFGMGEGVKQKMERAGRG